MSIKHAGVSGRRSRSVPNRTRYQTAPRPDFKKSRASTSSLTPRQARRAVAEVLDMFAAAYHEELRAFRAFRRQMAAVAPGIRVTR